MSVPLPSPSPLPSSAKPIPRRPAPISTDSPSSSNPGAADNPIRPPMSARSPSSPDPYRPHSTWSARSAGLGASPSTGGANGEASWRERNGVKSGGGKAPERTVGGFERKDRERQGEKDKEKEGQPKSAGATEGKPAALSHVPCRFFKAGACTAGASCPFSHEEGGKKEVCQWFLKGNCKFGHKCALAHVRPGEPMSMDRKNKKEQQREARDKAEGKVLPLREHHPEEQAAPVPIRSALSTSMQSPPVQRMSMSSSPMREPYGPPSGAIAGSPSAGFLGRSPGIFAASPSRPSPLSASFSARASVPGPLSLKSSATTSMHSPLRPPVTAAPGIFSSSFSHASPAFDRAAPVPLSASFADGSLKKSIWARSETPDEPLSPRRPISHTVPHSAGVFDEDDDHGEDLLPSSLSDLLTPMERARRMSRRDSTDSFGASPRPGHGIHASQWGGERLAQSAGAALGPGNFLQSLWSAEGEDARRAGHGQNGDFAFGPATAAPQPRQSLLSQQRAPISPHRSFHHTAHQPIGPPSRKASGGTEWKVEDTVEPAYFTRAHDPSSPSARALQEHAPGQSLPGGVATALSRLHLHGPRPSSGLAHESTTSEEDAGETPPMVPGLVKRDEHEEGVFTMDG